MELQGLVAALERQPDIAFAYLFGSHATDVTHPRSDVDVAILLAGSRAAGRLPRLFAELSPALPVDLDLVVLNDAPASLAYRIIRDGRVVYLADPSALARFREDTFRSYFDLEPLRRQLQRGIRDRVLEGRFG